MVQPVKIAVIGAGSVGSAIAYALLLRGICGEILMVDIDEKKCRGEVADLSDGLFLTNCNVRCGTFVEAGERIFVCSSFYYESLTILFIQLRFP